LKKFLEKNKNSAAPAKRARYSMAERHYSFSFPKLGSSAVSSGTVDPDFNRDTG
jgi:hypothetical protein